MVAKVDLSPSEIRDAQDKAENMRARDLCDSLGIAEGQLVAARCGMGATRIEAHPDGIIGGASTLGEVMALTRNPSCVHEKVGVYDNYHSGNHACMVLSEDIDLRIFPGHWKDAFALEEETEKGTRRSLQIFDGSGDALHKIWLRDGSDLDGWQALVSELKSDDQTDTMRVTTRIQPEVPKADIEKVDILRKEWKRMTDTHQFMRLTSKLKMNRLGAYRIAGEPFTRALTTGAVDQMLQDVNKRGIEVMVFCGNKGCIQIHSGPLNRLMPMGPWQNVMDPRFNLHLRLDHVAEVWAVDKPTQRGNAVSVEAFTADGSLIFQVFGVSKEGRDSRPEWKEIVADLPSLPETEHA